MRKYLRFTVLLALTAVLVSMTALADGGLDNFADVRTMQADTFSDVRPSDWFYSGVRSAYHMKIMDGVGGGRFAPHDTLPWSQAVTIAARVRAAYRSETIPPAEGPWYAMYVDYAQTCGILPDDHPEGSAWDSTPIDRQSIAYLFHAVVGSEDCPPVSDLQIPDLMQVKADRQESVAALYAAGIFTGKAGNAFDPEGQATRAEVATILSRLLRPALRVTHDSRVNADMVGQESNFTHSSGLAYDEEAVYLIFRDEDNRNSILRKDKATGKVTTLFSTGTDDNEKLEQLSLADGQLYFAYRHQNGKVDLCRMDPHGGAVETLCSTPKSSDLSYYIVYDGRIFTLQESVTSNYKFYDTLGELRGSAVKPFAGAKYQSVETLYAFGGKLYVTADYGRDLYAYDLETDKAELLLEGIECSVFADGKIYYILWDNGHFGDQVWCASLADLAHPMPYGKIPASAKTYYPNMAHDGTDVYYLASGERVLYRIRPDRAAEEVARAVYKTVENPVLWEGNFLQGNPGLVVSNYTGEYPVTVGIGTSAMQTISMDVWLGRSALMERTDFPAEGTVFTDPTVLNAENTAVVRRAYYSGSKLVLEIEYHNPDAGKTRWLKSIDVTLKAGETDLAKAVRVVNSVDVKSGQTWKGTIVIQGSDLLAEGVDLSDLQWQLGCVYNLVNG